MTKTIHGLVVRQTPYKEYDMILTVLSAEEGRLTVNARGAGRQGSEKAAASQLLCYSRMLVSEYRERLSLTEAGILDSFPALRGDIERLALGTYLCDMAALFMPEQEPAEDIHRLALGALRLLCEGKRELCHIKAVTEFAALCRGGFPPDLNGCARCGRSAAPLHFDLTEGTLHCRGCEPGNAALPLSGGVLAALRYIRGASVAKAYAFTLDREETEGLARACEAYFLHQTGKSPATLDFYKGLIAAHE